MQTLLAALKDCQRHHRLGPAEFKKRAASPTLNAGRRAAGQPAVHSSSGASSVRASTGVELAWVFDISGGDGPQGADATLNAALRHPPRDLVGFGLGGAEEGVRRSDYREVFTAARAAGLHGVPHVGSPLAGQIMGDRSAWGTDGVYPTPTPISTIPPHECVLACC